MIQTATNSDYRGTCQDCGAETNVDAWQGRIICEKCWAATLERQRRRDEMRARMRSFPGMDARYASPVISTHTFSRSAATIEALNQHAWDQAWGYHGDRNIYSHGDIGVGKTYMAHCILWRAYLSGRSIANISTRELCMLGTRYQDEAQNRFDAIKRIDLLLLDDVDKHHYTGRDMPVLWEVFNAREDAGRRTIITSQLPPRAWREQMLAAAGDNASMVDALVDRIKPYLVIEMHGESQRKA